MELHHLKHFTKEDYDNFTRALDIVDDDKLEAIGRTNFVRRHLCLLFGSLGMVMPRLSFDMRYNDDSWSITIEHDGNSWHVINYGGKILYYAPRDAYTISPAFVSVMVFKDLLTILYPSEVAPVTEELL